MKTLRFSAMACGAALGLVIAGAGPVRAQDEPSAESIPDSAVKKARTVAQDLIFRSVELDNRVRIREATNTLRQTPEIAAIRERIASAKTDEEARQARIAYYTALDRGLKRLLPDLKERISEMTAAALGRLEFRNVRSDEELAAELGRR